MRTVCDTCGAITKETTMPKGTCVYNTTKRISEVAKYWIDKGNSTFATYVGIYDVNVDVCGSCNWPDLNTLRFAYTAAEATSIMLKYVNELRTSVYGTSDYNLVASPDLIEKAALRAKQLAVNYSHDGAYPGTSENISYGDVSIYNMFKGWEASPGHYSNMIDDWHMEFGYAAYWGKTRDALFGAMLFR